MAEVPKKIEIQNTLAYEAYTDQVGIVHFIVQGKRITNKLTYPEKSLKFEFWDITLKALSSFVKITEKKKRKYHYDTIIRLYLSTFKV